MADSEDPPESRSLGERVREALGQIDEDAVEGMRERDRQLREAVDRLNRPPVVLPLPEPDPDLIEQPANIRRLVENNRETNDQLVALAQITGAVLAESRELRKTITEAERTQTRLTWAIIVLTAVLVVLTYLLVAEVVHWWPFA